LEKLQKDREKRIKVKTNNLEQDSTSLSGGAQDRNKSSSDSRERLDNSYSLGIRGLFLRLCTKMCMDVEVAEDD
jgi:hypothetical protein